MAETINDRIETLINDKFDGNKAAFAKTIGLPPTGLSNYLGKQRRSKPSVDMVTKIVVTLNVDARWLLTGEGSPFITKIQVQSQGKNQFQGLKVGTFYNESEIKTAKEDEQIKEKTDIELVGLVGKEFVEEKIILPPDCSEEAKLIILKLKSDIYHLHKSEKAAEARITELNDHISTLKETISALKKNK